MKKRKKKTKKRKKKMKKKMVMMKKKNKNKNKKNMNKNKKNMNKNKRRVNASVSKPTRCAIAVAVSNGVSIIFLHPAREMRPQSEHDIRIPASWTAFRYLASQKGHFASQALPPGTAPSGSNHAGTERLKRRNGRGRDEDIKRNWFGVPVRWKRWPEGRGHGRLTAGDGSGWCRRGPPRARGLRHSWRSAGLGRSPVEGDSIHEHGPP